MTKAPTHYQPFFKFDNFRPEVHNDVISGVSVDPTGVKAHVKFDDSRSKSSRDIRLPHFVLTTTTAYAGHHIKAKRHKAFCLEIQFISNCKSLSTSYESKVEFATRWVHVSQH